MIKQSYRKSELWNVHSHFSKEDRFFLGPKNHPIRGLSYKHFSPPSIPLNTTTLTLKCIYRITLKSPDIRKFDIFRWGHYLKNFKFYVLNVPPILWKRRDTIQGRTLYKGRHYLRKYGSWKMKLISILPNHLRRCHLLQ